MAKQEQILNIDPSTELKFVGPFTVISSTYLKLNNPTDNHVLFKIKTTAPKKYCVRPNSGLVEPKATVHVQVCLQPFVFDPNEKNKHKFMVQTLLWNPKGELSQDDAWKEAKPEQLMDTKLKCVFELQTSDSGAAKKAPPAATTQAALDNDNTRYVGGDSEMSTPLNKTLKPGNGNNDETLLLKTRKEMEQAQDDESQLLKDENEALREEIRLMRSRMQDATKQPYWNQTQAQAGFQTPMIVLAILAGLVGIILGKFLL